MTLGPRARKALRILGYIAAALVTFVYAVHLAFPYDRLKDKAIEALKSKYDVTVGKVERGWLPGDFSLVKVRLISRPAKPTEEPKVIFIDRIDIDVGVLSALSGSVDVDIEAKLGAGHISGTVTIGKSRLRATVSSRNLSLSDVPGLAGIIGMPMGGNGNVSLALDLPNNDWRKATARLAIECPHCTVGGEGAFFKPRNPNQRTAGFVGDGVAVPLMTIDKLVAEWTIEKTKIKTKKFEFLSPHITVALEFEAAVGASLKDSQVSNGCLRYRGSDALKALDEKFYNALELTGGPVGPDDQRHLKLVGTLGTFRAVAKLCGSGTDGGSGDGVDVSGQPRTRPDLSNVPTGAGDGAAGTTGTIEPSGTAPPDAHPAPPDAQPTPKVDDVRPMPLGPAPEGEVTGDEGDKKVRDHRGVEGDGTNVTGGEGDGQVLPMPPPPPSEDGSNGPPPDDPSPRIEGQ